MPVLVLGDSLAFGAGLPDDQTLTWYLREESGGALAPVTLAVKGYGLNQVLRQLEIGEPHKTGASKFPWAVVSVVDVNTLLPRPPQPVDRFYINDDGHPTALLNRMIASALVEDFDRGAVARGGLRCAR